VIAFKSLLSGDIGEPKTRVAEREARLEASLHAARRILCRAEEREDIVISLATPRLATVPATS
jgi:hypothetical protein